MRQIFVMLTAVLLGACSQSVTDYQSQTPRLKLNEFFNGHALAYGVVHDWQGKQSVRFTAQLCGSWQAEQGDLYEVFEFSDGRVEKRHWRLTQSADGRVSGTASDVVGEATGQLAGNTLYWQYQLNLVYQGDTTEVKVKDWLYLIDNNHLINRSTLHKFGLTVGEITLAIQKLSMDADCTEIQQRMAGL